MTRSDAMGIWFRPLIIAVMVGCVVTAFVDVIQVAVPSWHGAYAIVGCVLAALEANHSLRTVRARRLTQGRLLRFRAVELALLLMLLKAAGMIGQPWPIILAEVSSWPDDISELLDIETVVTSTLLVLSWTVATITLDDLQRVGEPPALHRGSGNPAERISSRFFYGGMLLLMAAGVARVGIAAVMGLERPPVPRLIANVVVYFLLGLALLGQVHLSRLKAGWDEQGVTIEPTVIRKWAFYSLAVIGLAALLAVLLPTGYTVGLLDLGAAVVNVMWRGIFSVFRIILFALAFVMWLLSALLSRLSGRSSEAPPSAESLSPQLPDASPSGVDWFDSIKTIIFWIVAGVIVTYVVRSYIWDHPELLKGSFIKRIVGALSELLRGIAQVLGRWVDTGRKLVPNLVETVRRRRSKDRSRLGINRSTWRSPRGRIRYYYLSTLERAAQRGMPRERTQTPQEYETEISVRLPDVQAQISALTDAFVEARYSDHAVSTQSERAARAVFRDLRTLLRQRSPTAAAPLVHEDGPDF